MEDNEFSEFESEKKSLRIKYMIIMVIVSIIVAVISSEFTLFYYNNHSVLKKAEASQDAQENINVIDTTLKGFRKVIDECYIGEIDEQKILDETIKGYINGLEIGRAHV